MLPFSYGPRACIGRRLAELESHVLAARLLQEFRVEWAEEGEVAPMGTAWRMVNAPDKKLVFRFVDVA